MATHRKRRPVDLARKETDIQKFSRSSCPFCPGNERKTPPASLVYLKGRKSTVRKKDTNGIRHKNWLIRCVPNLYSAFSHPKIGESFSSGKAVGHHEVLIESPNHNEQPANAKISQLVYVINGYIDRLEDLSSKPYVKYVSIFRNYGLDAGASLSHAHSQIIATPMIPTILSDELSASSEYYKANEKCIFCDIVEREKNSPRFIWGNKSFIAFAPWAGVHPFEYWITPKEHQPTLSELRSQTTRDLAIALKTCLNGLRSLLNDPPYNYGFHLSPNEETDKHYHWHLEVYPKLTIWAGFEKSTGIYINVVPPEDAARSMKRIIERN
ncbi:MAG: galactose-1-phosphate uridylyltransferase [Candidatus Bathyarchaeota archaeon]|nr:MAG: galactose-1-phosphate uridylyltransferase [Candidatus Bathyarchaeota archaeon]